MSAKPFQRRAAGRGVPISFWRVFHEAVGADGHDSTGVVRGSFFTSRKTSSAIPCAAFPRIAGGTDMHARLEGHFWASAKSKHTGFREGKIFVARPQDFSHFFVSGRPFRRTKRAAWRTPPAYWLSLRLRCRAKQVALIAKDRPMILPRNRFAVQLTDGRADSSVPLSAIEPARHATGGMQTRRRSSRRSAARPRHRTAAGGLL